MISSLSILFMVITLIISIGLPVALTIYMYKRYRISIKAVFVGALMFFVLQVVIRLPILTFIQLQPWYKTFAGSNIVVVAILLAFTAGLFETAGRYLGLKFLLKDVHEWENGIAYGIGHGGIESIILVGLTYVSNLIISILINTGAINSSVVPQLTSLSPDVFLAAGLERAFTIVFHIALSLIVLYGITKRRKIYILLCLLLHTLVDGVVVLLQAVAKLPIWGIEGVIAVVAIAAFIFIIKSKSLFQAKAQ